MRHLRIALASVLLAGASLAAQTPPKLAPCDTSSVLAHATPIFDVGTATLTKSCPAFWQAVSVAFKAHPEAQRWTGSQLVNWLLTGVVPVVVAPPPPVPAPVPAPIPSDGSLYALSNEAARAGALFSDDFHRGSWYAVDADHTPWRTTVPGWAGTIYANPIAPSGAVRNLQAIGKKPAFATSDYAGTTGVIGQTARNMALHNLSTGTAGTSELCYRAYKFFVPADYFGAGNPAGSYQWGAQKSYTINRANDDGGIYWAGVGYNIGSGAAQPTGHLAATNNHGTNIILDQNQGATLNEVPGHWYFEEWHIVLNTVGKADGVFELWVNDGGPTGDFSGQSPTLRARHTNVDWGRTSADASLMGSVWLENWSNPSSTGEQFWANLYASTACPIGFVRSSSPQ